MKLEVFDPALCCSSGVCGSDPDEALIRFSSDFDWLRRAGVEAVRYNLGQEPGAFGGNSLVRKALSTQGVSILPLVLLDGEILTQGRYPAREELASRLGLPVEPPAGPAEAAGHPVELPGDIQVTS
jgi:hypothetical protein